VEGCELHSPSSSTIKVAARIQFIPNTHKKQKYITHARTPLFFVETNEEKFPLACVHVHHLLNKKVHQYVCVCACVWMNVLISIVFLNKKDDVVFLLWK